ncbi:MAG: carboxypeptidase-like regulatory domain-containing protein, partial [Clostridia bacterium]|nr:carboxypeptidase-like regulatory domain-containing protein [Clostridia bacterium]
MKKSFSIFVIVILSVIMMSFIQTATITGRVTDEQSQPLAGVSVSVKGSRYATSTDNNGNYLITVGQNDRVLIFTLKGFETEEVNINSRTTINVVLRSGIVRENEVLTPVFGARNEMMFSEAQA